MLEIELELTLRVKSSAGFRENLEPTQKRANHDPLIPVTRKKIEYGPIIVLPKVCEYKFLPPLEFERVFP